MKSRLFGLVIVLMCLGGVELRAQYTWTGAAHDGNVQTPLNWQGFNAPTGSGLEDLIFSVGGSQIIALTADLSVRNITFGASNAYYGFSGSGQLTLTGNVTTVPNVYSTIRIDGPVVLGAGTHTISLGDSEVAGSDLSLFGLISGTGNLVKYGQGTLRIDGTNTFSGSVDLHAGTVIVHGTGALGTGLIKMNGARLIAADDYPDELTTTLTNNLSLGYDATFGDYGNKGSLIIQGDTTIAGGVSWVFLYASGLGQLTFGNLAETDEGSAISFEGGGFVRLTGTNTYTGGTQVDADTTVVFAGAPPDFGPLAVYYHSYLGTEVPTNLQADWIDRFDAESTSGIIGFDSPDMESPQTFSEAIDLSGLNGSVRIGTSTSAVLSGEITPAGTAYRFGGRGTLVVASNLTNEVNLEADDGIHLFLTGNNGYSGYTEASKGAAIVFASANALQETTDLRANYDGYIGYTEATGLAAADFLGCFDKANTDGVLGFDAANVLAGRTVSDAINLTGFSGSVFIGTSTNATLTGTITPAGLDFQFTGFRDGQLVVASTLTGNHGLVIGLHGEAINNPAPFGVTFQPTVTLTGTNTFTGDTYLQSGLLILGNANALSTGQLIVDSYLDDLGLRTSVNNLVISNRIDFGYYGGFTLGGTNDFTLSGPLVSYDAWIKKIDVNTVTLSGDNSGLAAELSVLSGTIRFASDHAAGTGLLDLRNFDGENDAQAIFTSTAPSMGSLSGDSLTTVDVGPGTLTINQSDHEIFSGNIIGAGGLTKAGTANLVLYGTNTYAGPTTVSSGTLIVQGGSITHGSADVNVGFANGDNGVLNIFVGGTVSNHNATIGHVTGSVGSVTVDGVGSSWQNSGSLSIGMGGIGLLNINHGGVVSSQFGAVAVNSGVGNVNIEGPGSSWNIATNLEVGSNFATGILSVLDRATLNVGSGTGTITLGIIEGGDGTLIIGDTETSPYGGIINAGTITGDSDKAWVVFDTGTTSSSPYYLTKDGTAGGTPVLLAGTIAVYHEYGYTVLSGNNTYSGGTFITGGTLVAGSNLALGTGMVALDGGRLSVAPGVVLSNPLDLAFGGILGGSGTFGSHVTAGADVVISPGDSPGTITFASGLTFAPGGQYDWQLQTVAGGAGTNTGWDLISISSGTLDLTTLTPGSFTVRLLSLNGAGAAGLVSDFNAGLPYTFTIATAAGGIVGFNAANFTIDATGFLNSPIQSYFSLSVSGNNLNLNFTPVPEPSTWLLLALGLGAGGLSFWRRRR